MKHAIFTIIVFFSIAAESIACGPFDRNYLARDYCIFRACGDDMYGLEDIYNQKEDKNTYESNCRSWADLTSRSIPLEDIREVVYSWPMEKVQQLHKSIASGNREYTGTNKFGRWLVTHEDQEVSAYLLLAKRTEQARNAILNPWYYAVDGDDTSTDLYEIANQAGAYKGKRLRDRYSLQQIRALFSMQRYGECLNVWNESTKYFNDGEIKKLALGYVAGAYYHLGEKDKASMIYLQIGDLASASKCAKTKDEFFDWVYVKEPDNKLLIQDVQRRIHNIEQWQGEYYGENGLTFNDGKEDYEKLYPCIQNIIKKNLSKQMDQWYYAGAFLACKLGKEQEALKYIRKAMQTRPKGDLGNSIRVLNFYLKVKYAKRYTQDLENEIYPELKWLDNMIKNNLTNEVKEIIKERGFDNHICGYSQYYWNDAMRKIVISELVPLCLRSNYKTRALQYLNMADNRIFQLVPNSRCKTIDEYRANTKFVNYYDYRNDYFMNLDSIGVKYLKALSVRMQNPISRMDRFLSSRSYNDPQFLYDIIGTQLIASMRFKEACKYLSKVSKKFNESRNYFYYCTIEPFSGYRYPSPVTDYKLQFARRMSVLENRIKHAHNKNDKAEAMLEYARGLQNSIGIDCWPLTSYYFGGFYNYPLYSQYQLKLIKRIEKEADCIKNRAFSMFTDKEREAKAYYEWKMFKTLVKKCGNTTTAEYVKGKCDNLYDYDIKPKINSEMRHEYE